jgi:TRAP-type uncharacterized transport system fused permease subunit
MSENPESRSSVFAVAEAAFFVVAVGFFVYLFQYYLTTNGGPTLLAFTMVPVTFILFTLDSLRKNDFYPSLSAGVNLAIAAVYIAICVVVSIYMYVEFEELGTVRAGFWDPLDMVLGGLMVLLVMEYARKRYFVLFVLNIFLMLYAMYGFLVPGMFYHPGLDWTRVLTMTSLEDTTGVFSDLPQLALTLIGSFVLVLATLRSFGCIDSILRGSSQIAAKSPNALPQTAVVGSFGVAAVSGSGAANAVTTGSATIPALIKAGMSRADAAAVETASSLGGQLMPPIMGISAFLMADFLDRSYFDVVARGYAPALIYFAGVSLGVYLISARHGGVKNVPAIETMKLADWINVGAFVAVVGGLIVLMAALHLPPLFAALYIFVAIASTLFLRHVVTSLLAPGGTSPRDICRPLARFIDNFASMTADLTLLLATLSILHGDHGLLLRRPARHGVAARPDLYPDRAGDRAAYDSGRRTCMVGAFLRLLPRGLGRTDATNIRGRRGHIEDRGRVFLQDAVAGDSAMRRPVRPDGGGLHAPRSGPRTGPDAIPHDGLGNGGDGRRYLQSAGPV